MRQKMRDKQARELLFSHASIIPPAVLLLSAHGTHQSCSSKRPKVASCFRCTLYEYRYGLDTVWYNPRVDRIQVSGHSHLAETTKLPLNIAHEQKPTDRSDSLCSSLCSDIRVTPLLAAKRNCLTPPFQADLYYKRNLL